MKKGYKVATVALARKLMIIMRRMPKEQAPFELTSDDGLVERKRKRMRTNLRRLKRLESRHGIENVFEAIQEVLERKK